MRNSRKRAIVIRRRAAYAVFVGTIAANLLGCATSSKPTSATRASLAPPAAPPAPQAHTYRPCEDGPKGLKMVDSMERAGTTFTMTDEHEHLVSPEQLAERYIADCSDELSRMTTAAPIVATKDGAAGAARSAVLASWRQNLHYMEWWLHNRRERGSAPRKAN